MRFISTFCISLATAGATLAAPSSTSSGSHLYRRCVRDGIKQPIPHTDFYFLLSASKDYCISKTEWKLSQEHRNDIVEHFTSQFDKIDGKQTAMRGCLAATSVSNGKWTAYAELQMQTGYALNDFGHDDADNMIRTFMELRRANLSPQSIKADIFRNDDDEKMGFLLFFGLNDGQLRKKECKEVDW